MSRSRNSIKAPITVTEEPFYIEVVSGTEKSVGGKRKHLLDVNDISVGQINIVDAEQTIIETTAKKIELPEDAEEIIIYHLDAGKNLFIGKDSSITTTLSSAPLESGFRLPLNVVKGNEVELFGLSSSGTITVYVIGVYSE